ncbi:hypothetical protein PR202_gb15877 [Eleusine coracana subsp. coracana]|uniref:Dirigent protein n=1 Tax=Eleusine coracana subsp. coracana TaxID=191504 RepID=A0AAV5EWN2_ELECO|nr:hypothetical protein PR202_gb15877 [Eleusine coracana subsp. coracana]
MAYYAIAPLLCMLVQRELYMHLYMHQIVTEPNLNQGGVVGPPNPNGFGSTFVTNWLLANGPDPNATLIGRAEGILMKTSQANLDHWYSSMNFVFKDTRFSGSTLKVMGSVPQNGEMSIIGGTGQFVMAQGVVEHTIFNQDGHSRIYELNVHAFYTPMASSMVSDLLYT